MTDCLPGVRLCAASSPCSLSLRPLLTRFLGWSCVLQHHPTPLPPHHPPCPQACRAVLELYSMPCPAPPPPPLSLPRRPAEPRPSMRSSSARRSFPSSWRAATGRRAGWARSSARVCTLTCRTQRAYPQRRQGCLRSWGMLAGGCHSPHGPLYWTVQYMP